MEEELVTGRTRRPPVLGRVESLVTNPAGWRVTLLRTGLRDMEMSFQLQSKGKREKNKGFHVCFDQTSWAEAIYPDVSYCPALIVWVRGPSSLSRTRRQGEPSSAVRHISMAQVPEVWLPSGQGRGPGYYSPLQEDSRAVFVFGNF